MRKKKRNKYKKVEHINAGQILEDIVYRLMRKRKWKNCLFYNSVCENLLYTDKKKVQREIDVFACHHVEGKRRYAIIIECKLSDRRIKAIDQLRRAKANIQINYPEVKVYCLYVHNYKAKTGKYTIEWIRRLR